MAKESKSAVADFLLRNVSDELVDGLSELEKLKPPIHDKHTFQQQLEEIAKKGGEGSRARIAGIVDRFDGEDFPILSVENAFEKYWGKFQPAPRVPPDLTVPDFPDEPGRPICEVYDDNFGRGTLEAVCACRAYAEARRQGLGHYQAVVYGHGAGDRARRTGTCEV